MPSTVRELAHTMVELGIHILEPALPHWRTVPYPPLPEEVLSLSPGLREAEDWRRWSQLHFGTALQIARHLRRSQPDRGPVRTSIARLAIDTTTPHDTVRAGLEVLAHEEAAACRRPDGGPVNPEHLLVTAPFLVDLISSEEYEPPPTA